MSIGCVLIYLYVDDLLILGDNAKVIGNTKSVLKKNFEMKNLSIADIIRILMV